MKNSQSNNSEHSENRSSKVNDIEDIDVDRVDTDMEIFPEDSFNEVLAQEELELSGLFGYESKEPGSQHTMKSSIIELLGAMARDEAAIAQLISAEAKNIEAFIGKLGEYPTSPTNQQINDFQHTIAQIMDKIIEKQKVFIQLIEMSTRLLEVDQGGQE